MSFFPSEYNYALPYNGSIVFVNGLTEASFEVPANRAELYRTILENANDLDPSFKPFIDKMVRNGFLVDSTTDEGQKVREKYRHLRLSHRYELMILPTYQCNFRCWYCTQDHEDLGMTDETEQRILKRMVNMVSSGRFSEFKLSWFGGEPALAYNRIVRIMTYARDVCRSHGVLFSSTMTTNSTLLTHERIDRLVDLGVRFYQITIDGPREDHNQVKRLPAGQSAFDHVMDVVDYICRTKSEKCGCTLRFNYTHLTLRPEEVLTQLEEGISREARPHLTFMPYKVWQEDAGEIDQEALKRLFDGAEKLGFQISHPTTGLCYADTEHFDCIFPNGSIGKCDNHSLDTIEGHLNADGSVEGLDGLPYLPTPIENPESECVQCRYLPLCWGPCFNHRRIQYENGELGKCQYQDPDSAMAPHIINLWLNNVQEENHRRVN